RACTSGCSSFSPSRCAMLIGHFLFGCKDYCPCTLFFTLVPQPLDTPPLGSAQVITSGCLFYPSQSLCLPVTWTVPSEDMSREARVITNGGLLLDTAQKIDTAQKTQVNTHVNHHRLADIIHQVFSKDFLLGKRDDLISPLLLGCSFIFGSKRLLQRKEKNPGENWVLISGIVGSCFIIGINPQASFRFGIGILLLVPTYCIATVLAAKAAESTLFRRLTKIWLAPSLACLVMVFNLKLIYSCFLLPPSPSIQPDLARATANQIAYYYVKGGDHYSCWYAPLPCSPGPLDQRVHLRDASLGLRGGFTYRRNQAEAKL
ncbi:MAG: hypothetical protein ACKO5P_06735, partial [Nodosilinea sp.]